MITREKKKKKKETVAGSSLAGFMRKGIDKLTGKTAIEHDLSTCSLRVFEFTEATATAGPTARVGLIQEGPGNRKTRYYYTGSVLKAAVEAGLFEGKQCYTNHPSKTQRVDRPERDVTELVGFFSDTKYETFPNKESGVPGIPVGAQRGMVTALFHPEAGSDTTMSKLREAAKYQELYPDKPGYFGFSIVAGGGSTPGKIEGTDFNIVSKLTEIDSIDMVTRAGAGGRLLSFEEGYMGLRNLFGGGRRLTESQRRQGKVMELRESISDHILESLGKVGVTTTNKQDEAIAEALSLLPSELITPAFVATVLLEAELEVEDDKIKAFETALGFKDGKIAELLQEMDDEESKESKTTKKEEVNNLPNNKNKKNKNDSDDEDDDPQEGKKKESAVVKLLKAQLQEANEKNEKLVGEIAEANAGKESALQIVRRSNAQKILSKSKLTESKKAYILDSLLEVDPKEQVKLLTKFEEAFGEEDKGTAGNPARKLREGSTGGTVISFDAMRK